MSTSPTATPTEERIFGVLAEFDSPAALLDAAQKTRDAGYREVEGYSPQPLEELSEILGHKSRLPQLVFLGGLAGAVGGFALQYWSSVIAYPMNIGGRPYASWPAWIVVTFEMAILAAAGSAVLGMLALNGLPTPHHPVFNVDRFSTATRDRYFLIIRVRDEQFELGKVRDFMEGLDPLEVFDVRD